MLREAPLTCGLLAAALLAGGAHVTPGPEGEAVLRALELRAGAGPAECWRWLTGHFAHVSAAHLAWNAAAVALLGVALERGGRARFAVLVLGAVATVDGAVAILAPEIDAYRGLSGIAVAASAALAVRLVLDRPGAPVTLLALAALGLKTGWDATGARAFVDLSAAGARPVPVAHAAGAAWGAAWAGGTALSRRRARSGCA